MSTLLVDESILGLATDNVHVIHVEFTERNSFNDKIVPLLYHTNRLDVSG